MKKVLVIEDDLDTRHIYITILEHHGYSAVAAPDGAQGVRMAGDVQPHLILMNLAMPAVDGIAATAALRSDERTAGIPIIACTGFIRGDGADAARRAGVDAYLEKPCEPSRIVEEVQRFIGPANDEPGASRATPEVEPRDAWGA
jgi:two-component system, cell cycle response regulator DivK